MSPSKATVVILFALFGTSCIEAWQYRDIDIGGLLTIDDLVDILNANPSMPEAITIQKNNVYNVPPSDKNVYGSIVVHKEREYSSNDLSKPFRERTTTVLEPGDPNGMKTYYRRSEYSRDTNEAEAAPLQQRYGTPEQQRYQEPYSNYQAADQRPFRYEPTQQRYPNYYPNQ
ncbi:BV15 family protein [Diolcogaster facetosa bracovirus]|uniref:BV15 family protein n=1 Tax=Bracoviriform facetosae TaxID=2083300 RepID=R9XLB9_9VIRU|nr:BV15 family protein [Diolcogaster facetosa bracovirus] [Bracoviriform facetosae]AGO14492.1 BV15 family protein [Diolcogaster facetosa bracovirus] [Bracoviriform facetosae]